MSEKRYPGIKKIFARLFRRNRGVKCVYAGPEYFGRVYAGPEPKNRPDETDIIDVYGGPEYFGEKDDVEPDGGKFPEDDEQFQCVYAGPEYFGEEQPEETDSSEDSNGDEETGEEAADGPGEPPETAGNGIPDPTEMRFVYGGPEYFARRRSSENGIQAPVYAGPEFFKGSEAGGQAGDAEKAPSPLTSGVYAGPEPGPAFFAVYAAPPFSAGMQVAPAKAPDESSGKKKFCHECGRLLRGDEKFCPDCGTKVSDGQ